MGVCVGGWEGGWEGVRTGGSEHLEGQVMTNKINVSPISRLVHWPHTNTHVT